MTTDVDYDGVSYVISSEYRVKVMTVLGERPAATPSTIAEETGSSIAHISRALQELRENGQVELLVDEERKKGRLYGLTEAGSRVVESNVADFNGGASA